MDSIDIPLYNELPELSSGGRSAWGLFGTDESVGRVNLQTSVNVAAAAQLVTRGAVFPLDAPIGFIEPPLFRRGGLRHTQFRRPDDGSFDDVYDNFFPQASSQWDSLAHVAYAPNEFYNGATADDISSRRRNTIEHWATRGIVGRGILLDLAATLKSNPAYNPGSSYAITVDDLEDARLAAGVQFNHGDILLIYTGFFDWYEFRTAEQRKALVDPDSFHAAGIEHTEKMAEYLWNAKVSAIASDCPSVEVWPPSFDVADGPFGFLHRILIGQFGIALGELWWLRDLAKDCDRDRVYEFLLTSAPLNVPGGIGSTANALAIK